MTAIDLPFAGGVYRFGLGQVELTCLEMGYPHPDGDSASRSRPKAVGEVIARTLQGRVQVEGREEGLPGAAAFSSADLDQIIYLGLLGGGGGKSPAGADITWKEYDVKDWMRSYVYSMPLKDRWSMATAILLTLFEGNPLPVLDAET